MVLIYYSKFKALQDELQMSDIIPQCHYSVGKEFAATKEKEKVYQFLLDLNDSFKTVHFQIINSELLPSLSKVYDTIIHEEK